MGTHDSFYYSEPRYASDILMSLLVWNLEVVGLSFIEVVEVFSDGMRWNLIGGNWLENITSLYLFPYFFGICMLGVVL